MALSTLHEFSIHFPRALGKIASPQMAALSLPISILIYFNISKKFLKVRSDNG